jgi:uncharacterized protein YerC
MTKALIFSQSNLQNLKEVYCCFKNVAPIREIGTTGESKQVLDFLDDPKDYFEP